MTSSIDFPQTPAGHALRVLAKTAAAWRVPPASPREIARRAPHGHVPARLLRRIEKRVLDRVLRRPDAVDAQMPEEARSWDVPTQGLRWAI